MSLRSAISARAGFAGLAVAGLVAGHCLAIRLFATADPHAHHHGGHSHAPYFVALIAGLLVAVVGSFVEARLRTRARSVAATGAALAVLQLAGFFGLSLVDRITGATGTDFGTRAFWFGLVIQVIVAVIGALVFALLRKTADTVRRFLHRPIPLQSAGSSSELLPTFDVALPSLAMAAGGPTFRGPPRHTA